MRIILRDKKGKSEMNDRVMNTYIYSTRDIVEALKKNGITKNTMQISKYIRDNNLDGRGMAIKNIEPIPGLNETHEVWRVSMYGTNEILKYFLDKRRQEDNLKKYVYDINQLIKKYGKEYTRCNHASIIIFMDEKKYAERGLAIKTGTGRNYRWLISQEGVDEMFSKLFIKKNIEEENKEFIYGVDNIRKELRKAGFLNNSDLQIYLEQLESEGLATKVPKKNGSFNKSEGQFRWRISEEGLEKIKKVLPIKENTLDSEDYEQIHLPDKEVQEKQKPITYKENAYEIVLDDEYNGYLSIISKSLNKNEVDVIRNLVEKFIDDKKEKIANIINF